MDSYVALYYKMFFCFVLIIAHLKNICNLQDCSGGVVDTVDNPAARLLQR